MDGEIFSRTRRRLNRRRALHALADARWLSDRIANELVDRLSFMTIEVQDALVIGDGTDSVRAALPAGAALTPVDLVAHTALTRVAEEDRLPVGEARFDLIVASGLFESLHDVPGALVLMRRALRPGGLFLGAMIGGGSLRAFRHRCEEAERALDRPAAARFHPQIDIRSAGDLLFRAGFSTPVADIDTIDVHYSSVPKLVADIRAQSLGNALPNVQPLPMPVGRSLLASGEITDQFHIVYLTGWAPVAEETRPRGPVKGFV